MFQYPTENADDLVAIKTSGKLDKEDLDILLPAIEEKIKRFGKVNFLWEMQDFHGWTPLGFLKDRLFDVKHATDFNKIAMVGEKEWEEKLAQTMKPFTSAQLRYFNIAERQQALAWVTEK